ncbi:hypothetical protein [Nonomuraea rhizosphaerae]|uniref:hypothetical protein n=1 Tax=Nonomuraea rhizosphaerae TaxID=2665663 RepID=UPI001C6033AC|nr:hypothetical protein [Nonomuraea rhizosphaerae]
MRLAVPPVPAEVVAVLAPLLVAGVSTEAAAERLESSTTEAWHYLDNLRLAGAAVLRACECGVEWCCVQPEQSVSRKDLPR